MREGVDLLKAMFSPKKLSKLKTLGQITKAHMGDNDKRVANAVHEAFEIMEKEVRVYPQRRDEILRHFKGAFGLAHNEAWEECIIACYNTAQYHRGLEFCRLAEKLNLLPDDELEAERAQFYGHLGEFVKAEEALDHLLQRDPKNVWSYINYGDLYYLWQLLPEKQNLHKAEEWYYKAFDKDIGVGAEDGTVLIERLGDICVEKLRRTAEKKLLKMLVDLRIGGWRTLEKFKQGVYVSSSESVIFHHLQTEIFNKNQNLQKANKALAILTDAYNLMSQKYLNDYCPFEMAEYYGEGEHTERIIAEKMEAYTRALEQGRVPSLVGAEGAEAFSKFQEEFMQGVDAVTGKKRARALKDEQGIIQKQVDKGQFLWFGFVKYRGIDDLSVYRDGHRA